MVPRARIDEFLSGKRLAIAGVRRSGQGFGATAGKELEAKGFELRPVHPEAATLLGKPCARTVAELAGSVDGLLLVTRPEVTGALVREAVAAGIRRIWLQPGAESEAAIRAAEEAGAAVVHGECILMHAEPAAFPHRVHRFFRRLAGRMPT